MFCNHLFPPYRVLARNFGPGTLNKKSGPVRGCRSSSLVLALILAGIDLLTVLASFGEESLWPDSGLMSYRICAFAWFLLPKCCEPQANTEPKRNIPCVS